MQRMRVTPSCSSVSLVTALTTQILWELRAQLELHLTPEQ